MIYLIIAAELTILYVVFWAIYIRNPKPYRFVGNPWGRYDSTGFTASGVSSRITMMAGHEKERISPLYDNQVGSPLSALPTWLIGNSSAGEEFDYASRIAKAQSGRKHSSECTCHEACPENYSKKSFPYFLLSLLTRACTRLNIWLP